MAKYYAVKEGTIPGVYTTWNECQKQVKGYKGAKFKAFSTEEEAKEFVGMVKKAESTFDKDSIKWKLEAIKEGIKQRDISYMLSVITDIAEELEIELEPDTLADYKVDAS